MNHKKINPNDSGGNVERWLIEVESMMKSLAYAIDFSMADSMKTERTVVSALARQVIICINQTRWCGDVEKTLKDGLQGRVSRVLAVSVRRAHADGGAGARGHP